MARVIRVIVSPILVSSFNKRTNFLFYASVFSLFFPYGLIKLVKCPMTQTVPPLRIIITEEID